MTDVKRILAAALLALALTACSEGAGASVDGSVRYVHDAENGVGCWLFDSGSFGSGMDCMPDSEYQR